LLINNHLLLNLLVYETILFEVRNGHGHMGITKGYFSKYK